MLELKVYGREHKKKELYKSLQYSELIDNLMICLELKKCNYSAGNQCECISEVCHEPLE